MNRYLKNFYDYNCSSDILTTLTPINNLEKEITEAMGVLQIAKSYILKDHNITVIDICAGNGLSGILCNYILKPKYIYAYDIRKLNRHIENIKNYEYIQMDIFKKNIEYHLESIKTPILIIGVHACQDLSVRIVDIFNNIQNENKNIILMPCCTIGTNLPYVVKEKLGKYLSYTYYLQQKIKTKTNIKEDKNILSPKNYIIYSI